VGSSRSGSISKQEFIDFLERKQRELWVAFHEMDTLGEGELSQIGIRRAMHKNGQ
jgi:hypothetical protein